ncbi:hypothetical protein I3843_03G234800 [Carya illinoinensis]|nr:hypothetical protein I3843_03G234800 [Carya illinoinensis]
MKTATTFFVIFSVSLIFSIQNLSPAYAGQQFNLPPSFQFQLLPPFQFNFPPPSQNGQNPGSPSPFQNGQVDMRKCFSAISKLQPCMMDIINAFLQFRFDAVDQACCTTFMEISDDCIAQQVAVYLQNPELKHHCSSSAPKPPPASPTPNPHAPSTNPNPPAPSTLPSTPSPTPKPPSGSASPLCSATPPPGDQPFALEPPEALPLPEVSGGSNSGGCWLGQGTKSKVWENSVSKIFCEITRTKGVCCNTFKPYEQITESCCVAYKQAWYMDNCKTVCNSNVKPLYFTP